VSIWASIWAWAMKAQRTRWLLDVAGLGRTTPAFRRELVLVADRLGVDPSHLAAVISFETAGTFDPAQPNLGGSGAIGLIQFLPSTARALGTSTHALARMTPEAQLFYVEKGLRPHAARLTSLEALYTTVLGGKPHAPDDVLRFSSEQYQRNKTLDESKDGVITAREATAPVRRILERAEGRPRIAVEMQS
jgi:hypothetical protein